MGADKAMQKWRIGIVALGLLSVGLLVFVIVKGVSSKSDRQTLKQVTTIADKLNSYVSDKQTVPVSLSEAGINDVPDAVSYTRKSSDAYEFCVTWKAANTDVSSTVQSDLYNATTNGGYSSSNSSSSYYGSSSYQPSDLYVSSEHKAGKQCQTVKPYIYSSDYNSYDNYGSGSSDTYNYDNSSDYYSQ